jgi:hypothetical protein
MMMTKTQNMDKHTEKGAHTGAPLQNETTLQIKNETTLQMHVGADPCVCPENMVAPAHKNVSPSVGAVPCV